MAVRKLVVEKADEVGELLREMLEKHGPRPVAQGTRSALIATRRASDAEVDAAGEEGLEHAEVLRDLEGACSARISVSWMASVAVPPLRIGDWSSTPRIMRPSA
jgi:hypothetical protein